MAFEGRQFKLSLIQLRMTNTYKIKSTSHQGRLCWQYLKEVSESHLLRVCGDWIHSFAYCQVSTLSGVTPAFIVSISCGAKGNG